MKTTIVVKNAYTKSVVIDCKVVVYNLENSSKSEFRTNNKGQYTLKYRKSSEVMAIPENNQYFGMKRTINRSDKNNRVELFIYPNPSYYMSILDSLDCNVEHQSLEEITEDVENKSTVFEEGDEEAVFPGGVDQMKSYLMNNLHYPEESQEAGKTGKVYIEFIVEKDGSLSCVYAKNRVSFHIDAEAVRVINSMPKWEPANVDGEKVRARCRIPLNFKLE